MTDIERQAIESIFITGGTSEYLPNGENSDVNYLISHLLYKYNHKFKPNRQYKFPYICCENENLIGKYYLASCLADFSLSEARANANKIFKEYMALKEDIIKKGIYGDPACRGEFNRKKSEWIKASNRVLEAKGLAYVKSLEYNSIKNWLDAVIQMLYSDIVTWHNLKENPKDLPKEEDIKWVYIDQNKSYLNAYYNLKDKRWHSGDNTQRFSYVTAWCDLPYFNRK